MEKKLTPMNELISILETEQKAYLKMNVGCRGIDVAIEKAKQSLTKERESIETAHYKGQIRADDALISKGKATEWFNKTYK